MAAIVPVATKMELASRLVRALGVTMPAQKVVLEMDFQKGHYLKLYVVAPAEFKNIENACELLEMVHVDAVSVSDDAEVTFVKAV